MSEFLLRVPDHLGDGVMAIPAVQAIAQIGTARVVGPRWAKRLYQLDTKPSSPDTAVLFKPSFSAAWMHRHIPRRVGVAGDWRRWLLTDVVQPSQHHRVDTYSAIAAAVGAHASTPPIFAPNAIERMNAPKLATSDVLLLPLSKSQATVGWTHFRTLADRLNGRAIFAAGPGECDALKSIAGPHRCMPALSIGEFSAVAIQASAVVGNDSGLSHLASASRRQAGLDPATCHVIFGSTDPEKTGPIGCTSHRIDHAPCQPCYRKTCRISSVHAPCLDVESATILEAIA